MIIQILKQTSLFQKAVPVIVILQLLLWLPVSAEEKPDASDRLILLSEINETSENTLTLPVRFFRIYISGADGARCPMHPSCSRYCLDAVKKNGAVSGWIMTCDRLMRCGGDELKNSRIVNKHFYDPVENNDFWWK